MESPPSHASLRAQLQDRAKVPSLPPGWRHQSAMLAAEGGEYGGDFIIAHLEPSTQVLQMVLVDVCGHGATAVPAALRFAALLQERIAELSSTELLAAANSFLLDQAGDEGIATAVHVEADLVTGCYRIHSAGHPPVLRWVAATCTWDIDNSRGTALGVAADPEFNDSRGELGVGDSLLFYTDGVVESRSVDIDDGIAWLCDTATRAVRDEWTGAARRIVDLVGRGEDDRAVLILQRTGE